MTIDTILRYLLLLSEFEYFFFRNILYLESKQAWENAPKSKQVRKPAKKKKKNKKKQTQK